MKRSEEESIFIDDLKQLMSEDITDEELEICLETLNILEKKGYFHEAFIYFIDMLNPFFSHQKISKPASAFFLKISTEGRPVFPIYIQNGYINPS